MIHIREHRGGPLDGRAEEVQKAEAEAEFYGYNSHKIKAMAIYQRAESKAVGEYIYHFFDFVKSVPEADGPKVLTELEHGESDDV